MPMYMQVLSPNWRIASSKTTAQNDSMLLNWKFALRFRCSCAQTHTDERYIGSNGFQWNSIVATDCIVLILPDFSAKWKR